MHFGKKFLGSVCLLLTGHVLAAQKDVKYADIPAWVAPVPAPTDGAVPDGTPLRIVYSDIQIHLGPEGDELFNSYQIKILRPEGLKAGNLVVSWILDLGDATVHYVKIIRDNQIIDVLKSTKFQILQREGSLEKAILNGELTAVLQAPGLQVGDELAFAVTVHRRDLTLGDHSFGFAQLPAAGLPGAFRIRMNWPKTRKLIWRVSPDVPKLTSTERLGQMELLYELRDPHSAIVAEGAPSRDNIRRFIEYSDFDSWKEVSLRLWPLFDQASSLNPDSPLRTEIARIAAANSNPTQRIEAALQLVEDRIRYVYIGLNGGNFTPASADQTWERRFGDCKAKTALLLAILRELGISGEAALVNSHGGDGFDQRLPTPALFDHVLVRAQIGDTSYWLDGTRQDDKQLSLLPPPTFRWALPLRSGGSNLERVPTNPPKVPDSIVVLDIDASRGFDEKATTIQQQILRGDSALAVRSSLQALSAEDADRALKAYWRKSDPSTDPTSVSWHYDEQRATLLLTVTGDEKLDWTGTEGNGYALNIPGAGFTPPDELHRPKEQDQSAPWITNYPSYKCWATTIHLPKGNRDWKWDYFSDPVNIRLGGVDYWRVSDLRDGLIRVVMSRRNYTPEITAEEAAELNKRLPTFNNKISRVYQILADEKPSDHDRRPAPPFQPNTDWSSATAPCGAPTQ